MKTFFEINNVIRMSFIEMQYMKKELLNALSAIDEMMAANDINMNMAAITPVAMLVYMTTRLFRFCFYALLKLGTSKEETYASFRHVLTDIERLLVMRDNPPIPHSPSHQSRQSLVADHHQVNDVQELCADDLGMIMLLIHECRSILWRSRRRFSTETMRSVYEDLSELAGERGAVSVRQQLQILERMSRTYRFLQMRHI
jgi:ATP synthase regulation protein NCA2